MPPPTQPEGGHGAWAGSPPGASNVTYYNHTTNVKHSYDGAQLGHNFFTGGAVSNNGAPSSPSAPPPAGLRWHCPGFGGGPGQYLAPSNTSPAACLPPTGGGSVRLLGRVQRGGQLQLLPRMLLEDHGEAHRRPPTLQGLRQGLPAQHQRQEEGP